MKRIPALLMAATLAAACGGSTSDTLADTTPDVGGLTLEMTGSSAELAREDGSALTAAEQDLASGPEYLAHTRDAIRALNQGVRHFLEQLAALGQTTPANGPGNTKIYGPVDKGGATYRLIVRAGNSTDDRGHGMMGAADKLGLWKLEAKPLGGADAAYQVVATGRMKRGNADKAHRGRGVIGVDLDKLATIDTTFAGRGKLFGAFSHAGETKTLVYRLVAFTPDPAQHEPLTAAFYGHKTASGLTRVRVAGLFDVLAGPNGKELLASRARWLPGVGGRADVILPTAQRGATTNGDVPAGKFIVGRSCWDAQEVEGYKLVLQCAAGKPISSTNCTTLEETGAVTACKPGAQDAAEPPADLDDTTPEPGAPAQMDDDCPVAMPAF